MDFEQINKDKTGKVECGTMVDPFLGNFCDLFRERCLFEKFFIYSLECVGCLTVWSPNTEKSEYAPWLEGYRPVNREAWVGTDQFEVAKTDLKSTPCKARESICGDVESG